MSASDRATSKPASIWSRRPLGTPRSVCSPLCSWWVSLWRGQALCLSQRAPQVSGSLLAPLLHSPFLFNTGIIEPFVVGVKTSHSTFVHSSLLTLVCISVVTFLPLSPCVQLFKFSPLSLNLSIFILPQRSRCGSCFHNLVSSDQLPFSPPLFPTTLPAWPTLFLQTPLALGFLSPAHSCPVLILPLSTVLSSRGLSFTASKMKDLQLLVMSRALCSPKPVQLLCEAPVSASNRLGGRTRRRSGLWRAAPSGKQLHSPETRLCRNRLCSSSGPFGISASINC